MVLQSALCIQHSSSAKWLMLWTYMLGTVLIEVLTVEGSSPIWIHRRLRSVYVPGANRQLRFWVCCFKSGEDSGNRLHISWPATAAIMQTKDKIDGWFRVTATS